MSPSTACSKPAAGVGGARFLVPTFPERIAAASRGATAPAASNLENLNSVAYGPASR